MARHLVVRDLAVAEGTHVGFGERCALAQHDPRSYGFAEAVVRHAEDRDVGDRLVAVEVLLDLARSDVLAAADDHVLHAADDIHVPVLVHHGKIARVHPAGGVDGLGGFLRLVPVAAHDAVAARAQLTRFAAPHHLAVLADDLHLHVRVDAADRRNALVQRVVHV